MVGETLPTIVIGNGDLRSRRSKLTGFGEEVTVGSPFNTVIGTQLDEFSLRIP